MATRWVLASDNRGKLRELTALLAPLGVTLVPQGELGISTPEESGLTFVENALLKARHAAGASGLPAIADDSGLCVDALGGAPGLYSARYAGADADADASDERNNQALLEALAGITDRRAYYHCTLVWLADPTHPAPVIASAEWRGHIAERPRGGGGFGYDPLFVCETGATAAELAPEEKARLSHRARASAALAQALIERG